NLALAIHQEEQAEQAVAQIKGSLLSILQTLGVNPQRITFQANQADHPAIYTSGALDILVDQNHLGHIGTLSLQSSLNFDLAKHVVLAEISLENLLGQKELNQFQPLDRFPAIEEDISLLMNESENLGPVIAHIMQAGKPLLDQAQVTTIYRHP